MKFPNVANASTKLSKQSMIVAVAALMPVAVSLYKMRFLDAMVLILSGALAVYNVNCLTRGNCNIWATVVSISFFIMTVLQVMAPVEGLEGEDEGYEGMEGETEGMEGEAEGMEGEGGVEGYEALEGEDE